MHPKVSRARAKVAALSRPGAGDDARRAEARRELDAANREAHIEKMWPALTAPLTKEQRTALNEILRPAHGRRGGGR